MGAKAKALAVGGDEKVLAHPGFNKIPPCRFALKTKEARAEYQQLARLIWSAGRLTIDKHLTLSNYAKMTDAIRVAEDEGRTLRASWFKTLTDERRRLELDDLDKPISTPVDATSNPYSRFGFPSRR